MCRHDCSGVLLLLLSPALFPTLPYLPLSTLAAILVSYIIFTPNIELFVRLWTFDSKQKIQNSVISFIAAWKLNSDNFFATFNNMFFRGKIGCELFNLHNWKFGK
jgi:hypothetical protein